MPYPLEAQSQMDLPVKNLTIAAVNINSITSPGRLNELQYFVDTNHIDILAVSEMKIDQTVHPCLFSLRNFHQPFVKPRTRRGGGVGVYISGGGFRGAGWAVAHPGKNQGGQNYVFAHPVLGRGPLLRHVLYLAKRAENRLWTTSLARGRPETILWSSQ